MPSTDFVTLAQFDGKNLVPRSSDYTLSEDVVALMHLEIIFARFGLLKVTICCR